jgi:hypothetical protein
MTVSCKSSLKYPLIFQDQLQAHPGVVIQVSTFIKDTKSVSNTNLGPNPTTITQQKSQSIDLQDLQGLEEPVLIRSD